MSDEEDDQDIGTEQLSEDEWAIPEPCCIQNSLQWSEECILAVAARENVYIIDPCTSGAEGLLGSVSLSQRDEVALVHGIRNLEAYDDTRIVEDLQLKNSPHVTCIAWSPACLTSKVLLIDLSL